MSTDVVVPAQEKSTVGVITKKVADPVVDFSEVIGVKTLRFAEDSTMKVTHTILDKTEEYTEKTLGHEKTEQLKALRNESLGIGTTAFHRMGGIANQFSTLVEETALGLLGVGKAAADIVTEGHPTGEKVRALALETIERLEDTTAKLTLYVGEGVEENFAGTRTADERALLLKDSAAGKGCFGLLLTLLASRDGATSVPLLVRLTTDRIRDRGARESGLFDERQVNETELADLITKFDENDNISLDGVNDIHLVVELLKRFFLDLPQPLLMTKNFEKLCASADNADVVAEVIADLPAPHRACLEFMLAFFKRMMQDAATNGATPQKIAEAFGPLWLRAPPGVSASSEQSAQAVNVVAFIIQNQDRIDRLAKDFAAKAEERKKLEESQALLRRGGNQFVTRNYQDALATWTEAARIRETVVGRNHKSNADVVANLAVVHTLLGNTAEARDLLTRLQTLMR